MLLLMGGKSPLKENLPSLVLFWSHITKDNEDLLEVIEI
jgi:hypothetical protein